MNHDHVVYYSRLLHHSMLMRLFLLNNSSYKSLDKFLYILETSNFKSSVLLVVYIVIEHNLHSPQDSSCSFCFGYYELLL